MLCVCLYHLDRIQLLLVLHMLSLTIGNRSITKTWVKLCQKECYGQCNLHLSKEPAWTPAECHSKNIGNDMSKMSMTALAYLQSAETHGHLNIFMID